MKELHNEVYRYLAKLNEQDPKFTFTLRRTNRANRLEKGYWFYGNDHYLAVSFWTGTDWKNRTPNIIFVINSDLDSYLEINVSDSDIKRKFVEEFLIMPLELDREGNKYRKYYSDEFEENYIASLGSFVENDKQLIDEVLNEHYDYFRGFPDESIGRISPEEFYDNQEKTLYYMLNPPYDAQEHKRDYGPDVLSKLRSFHIQRCFPIEELAIGMIPSNNQWIFLTGENGTGKTSILKIIAQTIANQPFEGDTDDPLVNVSYYRPGGEDRAIERTLRPRAYMPEVMGLAAYGTYRLKTADYTRPRREVADMYAANNPIGSLLGEQMLLDLHRAVNEWRRTAQDSRVHEQRIRDIKEILTSILPNLFDIRFEQTGENFETFFVERDDNDIELRPVTFNYLASGLKSLIAMIGDLLIRFYNVQPDTDAASFQGIVIIDEIDLHLHPNFQKKLVEQLTDHFPKIQFIVTTHSPIPLLGAPKESLFYKVSRTSQEGVTVADLSEIDFQKMLPNAILSSELFNMQELFVRTNISAEEIRTEDSIEQIEMTDSRKAHLQQIIERINQNPNENS